MYILKLYPYKMGSESATELSTLLNVMRVKPDGNYIPKLGHKVINWGNGRSPNWSDMAYRRNVSILNKPPAVNIAANKLTALQALKNAGVRVPEFTTDYYEAMHWLNNMSVVVERHELRGNSGDGIRIVTLNDDEMEIALQYAPLYTKYIPKTAEFRVHVFKGEVIDYIEKKKKLEGQRDATFNKYISSINCGWVFSRTNVRDIPEVRQIAIRAVAALGLDFGAVDIVFADGLPYVLECNTAPGLSGITLVKYANAFLGFMGQPNLPAHVIATIPGAEGYANAAVQPARPIADFNAVDNGGPMNEYVTLRIDRGTAIRLRTLLANI
jgi:RimK-like ATP-grasp domain